MGYYRKNSYNNVSDFLGVFAQINLARGPPKYVILWLTFLSLHRGDGVSVVEVITAVLYSFCNYEVVCDWLSKCGS